LYSHSLLHAGHVAVCTREEFGWRCLQHDAIDIIGRMVQHLRHVVLAFFYLIGCATDRLAYARVHQRGTVPTRVLLT